MNNQSSNFRIDELVNGKTLYDQLGSETIIKLSTAFYTRVYDDEEWFKSIFPKNGMQAAIRNQYEFFIQRFGGPPIYSQRKGHPALRARHVKFNIPKPAADRWLQHMTAAMDDVKIPQDTKEKMLEFFNHVANFLQNINDDGSRIY